MSDFETIIRDPKELGNRLLELKNKKLFCDVEIVVGEERISIHKSVLASSSKYFETMFINDESKTKVEIKDMDLEIVKSLLDYCYTGNMRVSEKNLKKTMQSAKIFKMTSIFKGCEKFFEKKLNSSNCIEIWKWAESKHFESLRKTTVLYARQNYEQVSQTSEFLKLNDSDIAELLNHKIVVTNETIVFNSVKKWIDYDASRKKNLYELMCYIRFEYLPANILSTEMRQFCSDNESTDCFNKIMDVQTWKNKKNKDWDGNPRDSYNTLTVVGSAYSDKSKTMEIFDLISDKWTKIENFECDIYGFSAVLWEHKLILIGGQNDCRSIVNTVQSYDLKTGTMENLSPMKYKRERLSAVEFKGRIYAMGGHDGNNNVAYVEMWDSVSKTWNELNPMLTPRNGGEASVLNNEIFVIGGGNFNEGEKYLSNVESYNPDINKWTKRASMNEKRYGFGVTVIGRYLYAVGGLMAHNAYSKIAEKYDPDIDKWSSIQTFETVKCWMGAGKLIDKFVIVGGFASDGQKLSTMEMYDDKNDSWVSMPSLNEPRSFLRAVEIPWRLAKAVLSRQVNR